MAVRDLKEKCRKYNEEILNNRIVDTNIPTTPRFMNRAGRTYGKLYVEEYVGRDSKGTIYYLCKCECGNEIIVRFPSLCTGNTSSCGCIHQEKMRSILTTHGKMFDENHKRNRLYSIYHGMKARCYNSNTKYYHIYGGKGVKICDEWLNKETGYINFYNWAMSNGYADNLSIDRIDSNGDYCPENCKWATYVEQANNFSRNVYLTYNEYSFTMSMWARILRVPEGLVAKRRVNGWSVEQILFTPIGSIPGQDFRTFVIPPKYLQYNRYAEVHQEDSQYHEGNNDYTHIPMKLSNETWYKYTDDEEMSQYGFTSEIYRKNN